MKKTCIFILVLMVILSQASILVFAEISFTVEPLYEPNEPPLIYDGILQPPDVVEINGVQYMWKSLREGSHPVKYDPETYDFFMGLDYAAYDCIFTGDYYIIRNSSLDYDGWAYKMYGFNIDFYDTELNLVHQAYFERYIRNIGFYDGTYYCEEIENGIKVSTDMINWVKLEDDEKFMPMQINNVAYKIHNFYKQEDNLISLNGGEFKRAAYEDEDLRAFQTANFGEWNVRCYQNFVSFSNDNIYHLIIKKPDDNQSYYVNYSSNLVYEYGNDIIIEWGRSITYPKEGDVRSYRIRIPKQPVYEELERLKSAPYVCLNNTILAFEEPPVVEDGNMLVPMRFLFEQMGAEVAWDNDTQTATVMQNNDNISFQINNATATVNDVPKTMNVPAKLVNDKTMVPIRFLSENLGYTVDWDGDANMAIVNQ